MRRRVALVAAMGVCALSATGCGASSSGSQTPAGSNSSAGHSTAVTIGISQPIGQLLLPFLAQAQGDFAKAGINATVKFVPSPELLPAIASGSVQFAVSSAPQLDLTALKAPVRLIAQWAPHADIQFVAAPGIRTVAGLKGKTISASSPGSASYVLTRKLLKGAGISVSDVRQVPLPSASLLAPAFAKGTIDGSTVGPPLTARFLSLRSGASVLQDFKGLSFTGSELAAYMPWATAHHAQTLAVVKALNQALTQWRTDPSAAKAVIAKQTGTDATTSAATYAATVSVFTKALQPVSLEQERSVLSIVSDVYQPSATPSRAGQVVATGYTN